MLHSLLYLREAPRQRAWYTLEKLLLYEQALMASLLADEAMYSTIYH